MADPQLVLEEPIRSIAPPSMTSLVAGILADVQKLLEQQLTLTRHELQQDVRKSCEAAWLLAIGATSALLAGIGLVFATAHCVSWAFPSIPLGGSLAMLGLVLAVVAWRMIDRGLKEFESLKLRLNGSPSSKESNDGRSTV